MRPRYPVSVEPLLPVGSKEDGKAADCVLRVLEIQARSLSRFGHRYGWSEMQSECSRAAAFWSCVAAAKRSNLEFWQIPG